MTVGTYVIFGIYEIRVLTCRLGSYRFLVHYSNLLARVNIPRYLLRLVNDVSY
jgi:hypothetical protein